MHLALWKLVYLKDFSQYSIPFINLANKLLLYPITSRLDIVLSNQKFIPGTAPVPKKLPWDLWTYCLFLKHLLNGLMSIIYSFKCKCLVIFVWSDTDIIHSVTSYLLHLLSNYIKVLFWDHSLSMYAKFPKIVCARIRG